MRNWRVLTAVIAVVFGVAAAAGSYYYLNKADERAQDKQKLVSVVVAKGDITQAMSAADAIGRDLLGVESRTKADVPPTAIYDLASIRDLVATAKIDKGQIITASQFVAKSQLAGGLSNQITPKKGFQAISVLVDLQHGVAGLVAPGDSINMIVSPVMASTEPADNRDQRLLNNGTVTAYLIPSLKVLAVDKTTAAPVAATNSDNNTDTPSTAAPQQQQANLGLMTLEVTNRQAEQIAHTYASQFPIYLTLNPSGFDPKDFKPEDEIVGFYNYFDQELKVLKEWATQNPLAPK